ncbi:MAG: DUF4301 domain-containing protein [Deltaproteobacteria bacterium HGW-Deltaproteobacteria-13]|jgi:hypothetical protein|nr:MAG: DUF4301 domain-containing protein [Deltaproteobacteria bacterium HGW-Deltaproteobacteria-13]
MKKVIKNKLLFSEKDIQQIERLGLDLNAVEKQLAMYRHGSNYLELKRPCTVSDGIFSCTSAQKKRWISFYEKESRKYQLIKFVPASGAASRMFAEWFLALESGGFDSPALNQSFLRNFKNYPFYALIKQNKSASEFIEQNNIENLMDYVLTAKGLNFGWLPKALIPFHLYDAEEARTALEEHLIEAAQYIRGADDVCYLHFTIAQENKKEVTEKLKAAQSRYESLFRIKYKISLSVQSPSTNILAVDESNLPLRDAGGRLVFRPGGHGSLLANLQNLDADFIFIKNIDNIAPEHLLKKIIPYKKMLGGLAIHLQKEIFASLHQLESEKISVSQIEKIMAFCQDKLNIVFSRSFGRQSQKEKIKILFCLLNRPLRICGVVRNKKEPGGGPFWVNENDGTQTLQIVEGGHVDKSKPDQVAVWSRSEYFNPVDMVCGIKNYKGEKFDLSDYVDKDAYLISRKNEKGRRIKALEVPGLWNGGMAYWNTVLVKLPIIVFNPVKTVNDLLRPEHLIP